MQCQSLAWLPQRLAHDVLGLCLLALTVAAAHDDRHYSQQSYELFEKHLAFGCYEQYMMEPEQLAATNDPAERYWAWERDAFHMMLNKKLNRMAGQPIVDESIYASLNGSLPAEQVSKTLHSVCADRTDAASRRAYYEKQQQFDERYQHALEHADFEDHLMERYLHANPVDPAQRLTDRGTGRNG